MSSDITHEELGRRLKKDLEDRANRYLEHLDKIAGEDAEGLKEAQRHYGDSWKKRGGVGAFMMLARKWDRIENRVQKSIGGMGETRVHPYDIFEHIEDDGRDDGLIDDIRDLRRYLMLVEAEARARGYTGRDQH